MSGTIQFENKEPATGVLVFLQGTTKSAVSDAHGKFELASIPYGNYMVETSYDQERQAYPVNFPDRVIIRELQKNWDKFKLNFSINEREKPIIKMTGGKGHETL